MVIWNNLYRFKIINNFDKILFNEYNKKYMFYVIYIFEICIFGKIYIYGIKRDWFDKKWRV